MLIASYSQFLDAWFVEIEKLGIDVQDFKLDHLGYSVSSSDEYAKTLSELLTVGDLFREATISDRRVGIIKLHTPLKYKHHKISAIEVLEPKSGEKAKSGFEHAEFTIPFPLQTLVTRYPQVNWDVSNIERVDFPRLKLVFTNGLEVKFNTTPLLKS